MHTIFTVQPYDLERLNPKQAVDFFRELLWAEAARIGISFNKINISSHVDVADGGIDASIRDVDGSFDSGLIKTGLNCYQIKAGSSFIPWQESQIKKELFSTKTPGKENLGKSIKNCFDNQGAYIQVCFKQDLNETQNQKALKLIRTHLKKCGYQNPKVEIWGQNNIIGFLYRFPSLALKLNGRDGCQFQTHKSWASDAEMSKVFEQGKQQLEFIKSIRDHLSQNNEAIHLRVWGDPGIGKTRLVLEATRSEELKSLVIYCDAAGKFRDSVLMNEILRDDNPYWAILVIDECDPDSRSYIWNKLKYRGPRIKLITIYNEPDETTGNIKYLMTPLLEDKQVSKIIQFYGILGDQAFRWVKLCGGSPRMAHLLGENLRNNPEDLLKSPDTVNIWERCIVGGDQANEIYVQQRKLVLQYIALFKRFGYKKPMDEEAKAIAKLIESADTQITWIKFREIIKDLIRRKILQGEYTLYITPKLLHIKLWTDWWNTFGDNCDPGELLKELPGSLQDGFFEMFKYARESKVASHLVRTFLGENGPFVIKDYLRKLLAERFLSTLAEADPEATLRCLKKSIGTLKKKELLEISIGRRELVRTLEQIAIWRELFPDAARLLLALGEAENESWSNNASGVFAGLFSNWYDIFSPTEASPEERFPILEEALNSESKERRLIALDACDKALSTHPVPRTIGAEYQGLREEAQLWIPKTKEERYDAYSRVWNLLYGRLDSLPEDEQQKVIDLLLSHARGLSQHQYLSDMIRDTLTELSKKNYIDKRNVLVIVLEILGFDGKYMPQLTRQRWEKLKKELTGHDFSSRLRRFAGLDLLVDQADEEGNLVDKIKPGIEDLARQAVENPELLRPELNFLTTIEAQNGFRFGYELAKKDNDFSLLPMILEAQRKTGVGENASIFFLGGYFKLLFEKNLDEWEHQLDELVEDQRLNYWLPGLVYYSGMTDKAALHILELAEKGIMPIEHFKFFKYGKAVEYLSEDIFKKWIDFLLKSQNINAVFTALAIYHSYYIRDDSDKNLPEQLTMELLFHPLFFKINEEVEHDQMNSYYWRNIGQTFVKSYPGRSLEVAEMMLKLVGNPETSLLTYFWDVLEVFRYVTIQKPVEVWKLIVKYLVPISDIKALFIGRFINKNEHKSSKQKEDDEGILSLIPLENIWEWVDEDIENRASYLAYIVPDKLFKEEGKICLAREILVRYGSRQDVRDNLMSNFYTGSWWGPFSQHLSGKKQKIVDFKKHEDNENVILWLDEYISKLDREIEEAKIKEERRG